MSEKGELDMSDKDKTKEKRKKILEQMEFYFSDSNLCKDRFLKKEILKSEEGFIDLNVFIQFNKIRTLTSSPVEIAKAVKKSESLELNEEKTMIRRRTQFVELSQEQIDKRTIYAENIPSKLTSETMKTFFQQFGKVVYVSLPKFQTSHQLKGFAFIEFDEKNSAKKAIEYFKDSVGLEEKIGIFPKTHKVIADLEKKIKKVKEKVSKYADIPAEYLSENRNKEEPSIEKNHGQKRKNDVSLDQGSSAKKQKTDDKNSDISDKNGVFKTLRVISKKKWLSLREDFLNKQKEEVIELRTQLDKLNELLQKKLNEPFKTKNANVKTDDIQTGCIIKLTIKSSEENDYEIFKLTRQKFKEQKLKGFEENVVYVDLDKNCSKIFIRCKSKESAASLLKNKDFLSEFQKSLLEGQEEVDYFEKICSNRVKKIEKKEKKRSEK